MQRQTSILIGKHLDIEKIIYHHKYIYLTRKIMNKFLIALAAFVMVTNVEAQLIVTENGQIQIGDVPSSNTAI